MVDLAKINKIPRWLEFVEQYLNRPNGESGFATRFRDPHWSSYPHGTLA